MLLTFTLEFSRHRLTRSWLSVKFLTTFETDLICPAFDCKHAAHLVVTTPKH